MRVRVFVSLYVCMCVCVCHAIQANSVTNYNAEAGTGGALYVVETFGRLNLTGNIFANNSASVSAGAVFLGRPDKTSGNELSVRIVNDVYLVRA